MKGLFDKRNELSVFLTLLIVTAISYAGVLYFRYEPYTYLKFDPGWTAEAARSVVEDGDLDLRNQLGFDPRAAGDQTALGLRGEWYPVHEILLPVAAAPFYAVLGINGLLLCNYISAILLVTGCYLAAARLTEPGPASFAALATALSPVMIEYVYSFSVDLCGAALLVWTFNLAVRRNLTGSGLLLGFSVFGRIINAFTGPAFLIYAAALRDENCKRPFRPLLRILIGGLPVAVMFFAANQRMFGGPLEIAYRHWVNPSGRLAGTVDQAGMFNLNLLGNLVSELFNRQTGLLAGSPLVILAVIFGAGPLYRRDRAAFFLFFAISASLLLGIAAFERPSPGSIGNRYLLGITAISALPLALFAQRLMVLFKGSKGRA